MIEWFPAAARPAQPWKNGGGVTRPVAAAPGVGREFGWRLSLADVEQAGPFSCFPGIMRLMGILHGRLRLEVAGAAPVELGPDSKAYRFAGDAPCHGAPLGGLVQDVNLMFDPALFTASLSRHAAGAQAAGGPAAHLLLALAPLTLNGRQMDTLDAALVPAGTGFAASGALWVAALSPAA